MDRSPECRRIVGALGFLAELGAVAAECAATGVWDDELTARRRHRGELRTGDAVAEEFQVKAL